MSLFSLNLLQFFPASHRESASPRPGRGWRPRPAPPAPAGAVVLFPVPPPDVLVDALEGLRPDAGTTPEGIGHRDEQEETETNGGAQHHRHGDMGAAVRGPQ